MNPSTLKIGSKLRHKFILHSERPELENEFEVVAISVNHVAVVQKGADPNLPTNWLPDELPQVFDLFTPDQNPE